MSRFALSSVLLSSCLLVPVAAGAQVVDPSKPVFTAQTVHPVGSPELMPELMPEPPGAGPAPRTYEPVPSGRTPRAHAQEMAEVFRQACVASRGDAGAASDWAVNQGFSPSPTPEGLPFGRDGAPVMSGFQSGGDDPLVLVVGREPVRCAVLSNRPLDGPRLRERVAGLAAAWVGKSQAPAPMSTRLTKDGRNSMVTYQLGTAPRREYLSVLGPTRTSGPETTFLLLQIDDAVVR